MEINRQIFDLLKEAGVNRSDGTLYLLGIYFNLDVGKTCTEATIKAVNTIKIVERDHYNNSIQWNVPLFVGQEVNFAWVKDYNEKFGKINPARMDALEDVIRRMKEWFAKYPHYRVPDVIKATDMYLNTVKEERFLTGSLKFILDYSEGKTKPVSKLLGWCEKAVISAGDKSGMKGRIIK